jgi:hypothetical protein
MGGFWINMGLPAYITMDRKPENSCEIQDACDGETRVMLRLKLVKTAVQDEIENQARGPDDDGLLHSIKVLKDLVEPWFHTNRVICADSYFTSVPCANEMR